MRLGDFVRTLIFQAPSGSPVAWTTIFTCKGSFVPLSSQERIAAMSLGGTMTGTIRIAYRPVNIKTTWRVLCEGKTLNIASLPIDLGGEHRFLELKIKEVG